MPRYLDPRNPLLIKKVFGDHPHLLLSFLNAVLPLPKDAPIQSLEYLPSEQVPEIPTFKRTIVDVKCTDRQGRIFIVEMQMEWVNSFMQRMLFNAGRAYIKQLKKGEDYSSLYPVYALGILNSAFDPDTAWYHHYQIVNIENTHKQLKGLEFVFVELPKFKASTREEKKLAILWLRFLSDLNEKTERVSQDLLDIPEINEACTLAEEAAYSKEELEVYWQYWDQVSTERTLMSGSRAEGKAEGKVEGKAEGEYLTKVTIARNLIAKGMRLDEIAVITGLPLAEIETLKP
ncbi:MAG: Rpn family recombination-promoting nuclease/putative transposase [Gammaproteobacteria bacterium]|nr:Rpn family recombination-promoting nuclease/putative transposase [Gammaproteobacteria bacterium]